MAMKETTFQKGLKVVEAGLQGTFQQNFIDFLWTVVKDVPADAWMEGCTRLALETRKTGDLVVGDFMEALRGISQEKARRASLWTVQPKPQAISNWKGMAEKVCSDPEAAGISKAIARNLAARKEDAAPAAQGGERYRRQD